MSETPFSTGIARWAQFASLPWRLFGAPTNAALLEGLRRRNSLLDALFYDVQVVCDDEAAGLGPDKAAEGALLIVPPSGAGRITLAADLDAFFAAGGGALDTIAVAGVGSSALGTAAFARNVADALGRPVAAVVSGYGLADLITEATGGLGWAAGLDELHAVWQRLDRSLDWLRVAAAASAAADLPRSHRDSETLLALLRDPRIVIARLVAHSKGTLALAHALHALQRLDRLRSDTFGETVAVVAISARTGMPRSYRRVTEVVGRWDRIGDFAMRREAPPSLVVPDAWHHTNTELFGHLPVTRVLKDLWSPAAP